MFWGFYSGRFYYNYSMFNLNQVSDYVFKRSSFAPFRLYEWMDELINELMNERINELADERMNERTIKLMNE